MTQAEPRTDTGAAGSDDGRSRTDWTVFGVGAVLALLFVVWGIVAPENLGNTASTLLEGVMRGGGWGFILAATAFVAFALFLAFSKFGRIKLGTDTEEPEFRTVSWIAMMFSAGMGMFCLLPSTGLMRVLTSTHVGGNVARVLVPAALVSPIHRRPPWASTMERLIDKPRPRPSSLLV